MKFGTEQKENRTKKNCYQFNVDKDRKIQINSNFDGGNISLIKQVTELQYRLQCVPDALNSSNKKCWFYFSVSAPKHFKLRFYIEGVSIYESMYQEPNWGKPVYKIGEDGKWQTLKDSYLIVTFPFIQYRDQVNLMIDYYFETSQTIYIAMSIPFTYWEMEDYINGLKYLVPESISYTDEVIKETKTGKNLHMLTIEDKSLKAFKDKSSTGRSIVLITGRVHPGEVSGTYCLMGMLDFIFRHSSLQSEILRKMFTFVVIPMVNPEGVYEGNYRMDLNGQNLNRVYIDPHPSRHETVYAIKEKIGDFLKKGDRIVFHFDLHSHSTLRRSFIYGNAFDDIILQTETEVFCKLLDRNCEYFQQSLSQFGQKHMKFKDRGQNMSKEGCARVVLSKMASITYSYTVESSIFPIERKSFSQKYERFEPINCDFKIQEQSENKCQLLYDSFEDKENQYSEEPNIIDQNRLLGVKIMISILDLMLKNPYSQLDDKILDEIRKHTACRILQNEERFKMLDTKAYHKSKFISQFAKIQLQSKFKDEWSWLAVQKQFCNVQWPQNFQWFKSQQINMLPKQRKTAKTKTENRQFKISSNQQNQVSNFKLFPNTLLSNRVKLNLQIQQLKNEFQRLPLIRKSLQTKRYKTDEKQELMQKREEKFINFKFARNVLITNRSNILLTFIDEAEEKKEQKRLSKKRMISLKMASLIKNSVQKTSDVGRSPQNILQLIENESVGLKPSHSQGQLSINIIQQKQKSKDEDGMEFQDRLLTKNLQIKKSRKDLMSKKISMLKKINECKKQNNKNAIMKFPEIGKAFLITNAKKKFDKLRSSLQDEENEQKSTVQSSLHHEEKNSAIQTVGIKQNENLRNTIRFHTEEF